MAGSLCRICGRAACRCGEPYHAIRCPRHGDTMAIVSMCSRRGGKITGNAAHDAVNAQVFGWKWFEAVGCTKCDFMRPLKYGQGVPRNENRKTDAKVIDRMRKKFGAQIKTRLDFTGETGRGGMGVAVPHAITGGDLQAHRPRVHKEPSEKVNEFFRELERQKQIKDDEDVPF